MRPILFVTRGRLDVLKQTKLLAPKSLFCAGTNPHVGTRTSIIARTNYTRTPVISAARKLALLVRHLGHTQARPARARSPSRANSPCSYVISATCELAPLARHLSAAQKTRSARTSSRPCASTRRGACKSMRGKMRQRLLCCCGSLHPRSGPLYLRSNRAAVAASDGEVADADFS